jgi:DNA-directed RNA polymerase subunit RPC12/RpoP
MPTLACHVCGRIVETSTPVEALTAEERRCPRCGSRLDVERRSSDRRQGDRRVNQPDSPGPPGGIERRVADRRQNGRRRDDGTSSGG